MRRRRTRRCAGVLAAGTLVAVTAIVADIRPAGASVGTGIVPSTTTTVPSTTVPLTTVPSTAVPGRTFYVSATGSDTATGLSPATAWKTLARAGEQRYAAGDRLLLAGGQSFPGHLSFSAAESGTATAPITISTYGTGRATVSVTDPSQSGILIQDAGGYRVSNLDITGPGPAKSTKPGLMLYSTVSGRRAHIQVADVSVSAFNQGLVVGAVGKKAGFTNVTLTSVTATDNADSGIATFGDHAGSITDLRITDALATDNPGVPGKTSSTGNGIVLGGVSDAVVSSSIAARNGALDVASLKNGATNGPAGMWAYDSTGVTFRNNESYDNSTGNHVDGDGFDLDQSVTNSVLEYNYSYGNAGAGFLLDGTAAHPNRGNTVRYNISDYNGWANDYAGLEIIGSVTGANLYNNTVYVSPFVNTNSRPQAVHVLGAGATANFYNNLLVSSGGLTLIQVVGRTGTLTFQGNDYWSSDGPLSIVWGNVTYHGLPAWRSATRQELLDRRAVGMNVDPEVLDPSAAATVGRVSQLTAMTALKLKTTSPLVGTGLKLSGAPFNLSTGSMDFFGTRIGSNGPYGVGADQIPVHVHKPILPRAFLVAAWDTALLGACASALQAFRRRRKA